MCSISSVLFTRNLLKVQTGTTGSGLEMALTSRLRKWILALKKPIQRSSSEFLKSNNCHPRPSTVL
jgi:hypothetical protein